MAPHVIAHASGDLDFHHNGDVTAVAGHTATLLTILESTEDATRYERNRQ